MSRIPEPEHTPRGPAYEGRLLDRADDEVVDQGAPFDIRTVMSRRGVLSLLGIGVGAAALAACAPGVSAAPTGSAAASASGSTRTGSPTTDALPAGEIPEETAGPFPGDGSNGPDILEQSGIVRSDIRSSIDGDAFAAGVPLTLSLVLLDTANGDIPLTGAAVYVWHCDAQGGYSMYSDGLEDVTYLRGVQTADAAGTVTFTTVFPGCYPGRWPHVHFEVYPDVDGITDTANVIATSQVALPRGISETVYALPAYEGSRGNLDDISLSSDMVFRDDGGALQMATVTGDATAGYTATLRVRVDTRTSVR
ncbi:intradiol ring-cleavage dioxygenase [Microbacterium sp. cx-59]|uniref:intradiol ring-cleavage dioxygenase n=1 Tax=Microbacterium sp. cx-59 TaxID=2891207 RepID=UPI001E4BE86E|nr:intradiol ring-cleavage dioxygenase [Microbacterium sp. cx-59]MCC4908271.1 intradiol ring-cleavage dioxygenase [Microbacterium sp. cx-59]